MKAESESKPGRRRDCSRVSIRESWVLLGLVGDWNTYVWEAGEEGPGSRYLSGSLV